MTTIQSKGKSANQNPLNVPVSSVGSGFVAVLPGTPKEMIAAEPLTKTLKIVTLEHINTEWLTPFLSEYELSENHTPQGLLVTTLEGGLFQVKAHLKFAPKLECARCIEHFRLPIETEARAVFADKSRFTNPVQNSHRSHGRKSEEDWNSDDDDGLSAGDLDLYEFSGLAFSLDEFLLDSMQTEIPDVPNCAENCPGLCSTCGNLNTENHKCRK